MPVHFTQDKAKQIFNEIITLRSKLIEDESQKEGRQLDPGNDLRDMYVV